MEFLDKMKRKSRERVYAIAAKEAAGKAAATDERALSAALKDGELSVESYDGCVALLRRHVALKAQAAGLDAAGRQLHTARRISRDWAAETLAIVEARDAKSADLIEPVRNAAAALRECETAQRQLEVLETDAWQELGLERLNLDEFTLRTPYGETVINDNCDSAPIRHVSGAVFARESARRRRLVVAAEGRERSRLVAAVATWNAGAEKSASGEVTSRIPEPVRREIGWADVLQQLAGGASEDEADQKSVVSAGLRGYSVE